MFTSRNHLLQCPISLQSRNHSLHIPLNPQGVFPRRLRPSAPSRVFVRVDVRRPVIQPAEAVVGKGAGFGADGRGDFVHQVVVEGGAQSDGVGEGCGVREGKAGGVEDDARGAGDAVQAFRPPGVGGESETGGAFALAVCVSES